MENYSNFIAPKPITQPNVTAADRAEIKKAAKDFEAMFISEMMKPMFEGQDIDPLFGGGKSEEIYRSMMIDEYGKEMSKAGGIGIAANIEREMLKLQEVK